MSEPHDKIQKKKQKVYIKLKIYIKVASRLKRQFHIEAPIT